MSPEAGLALGQFDPIGFDPGGHLSPRNYDTSGSRILIKQHWKNEMEAPTSPEKGTTAEKLQWELN